MKRALGRFEVTCLGINAIIGAGIFALPDDLFRDVGGRSPFVFAVCAVALWPIAWCYAEASAMTERTGGPYIYVRSEFGPLAGFIVGWMCFINSIFAFAAVARVAAAYLGRALPLLQLGEVALRVVAVGVIVVFCGLNAFGAKPGARAAAAFTIAKLAALLVLVGVTLPLVHAAPFVAPAPTNWQNAVFVALFAVQGFEVTPVPAGETRDAKRIMPFAILGSLVFASIVYVTVQGVMVGAYPGLGAVSETPLADAARAVAPRIGLIVVWGGIISTIGFVAGDAFGTPRYAFAMAEDGYLPRVLAVVGKRFGAPVGAIFASGICATVLAALFPARALVGISNLAVAVQYLGTCLAIGRRAMLERERRMWRVVFAVSGALVSLWIFTQGDSVERSTALITVALGLAVALGQGVGRARSESGR